MTTSTHSRPQHEFRRGTRRRRAELAADALAAIAARSGGPVSLDGVAAAIFTSRRQLQRVLLEEAGVTFRTACRETRIAHAQRLLIGGDLRVGEVSERVGYRSRSEFTKAFRAVTGELPSELRRRAIAAGAVRSAL